MVACNTVPVSNANMSKIMYDVMIMEAGNQVKYNYGLLPKAKWKGDYTVIAAKHHMDTNKLKEAFQFYSKHPDEFSKVMETTITLLQDKQLMPDSTTSNP